MSGLGLPAGTHVFVISGPGGVGKGTLVAELLRRDPRLWLSRSWTTRDRRPGESPDAYHFVSRERFRDHIDAGGFVEWVEFLDYLQGSPLPTPPEGCDVVFEIDVQGARLISELHPEAVLVFVDAPSRSEQEARLRKRGDAEDRVLARLAKADEEAALAVELDMVHVVNDQLDRALAEVEGIVARTRGED